VPAAQGSPNAALTSATVTMAQVTFEVGWAEVGVVAGRAAGDVAVAVVGVGSHPPSAAPSGAGGKRNRSH